MIHFPRAMQNEGRIPDTGTPFANTPISRWVTPLADEGNPLPAAPSCPSSAARRRPVTGHKPREGGDLAAKLRSSGVTGGLPPSFYSVARCSYALLSRVGSCRDMGHLRSLFFIFKSVKHYIIKVTLH